MTLYQASYFSHHLFSMKICLFNNSVHEGWGEHALKDFQGTLDGDCGTNRRREVTDGDRVQREEGGVEDDC